MSSDDWLGEENAAIRLRREKCGIDAEAAQRWGLALSGGGIRSATFCLGVIKALARNGLLTRFDYLSTVSGGGYAGSALGRLYQAVDAPDKVQAGLSKEDRLFWWWLRKNGRYLFPAGVKDALFAGSTMLRNLTAIYFDLFQLGLLVSCLIVLPHLLAIAMGSNVHAWADWAPSAWWIFAATMPMLFLVSTWAYWFSASQRPLRVYPSSIAFGIVGLLVAAMVVYPELSYRLMALAPSAETSCVNAFSKADARLYAAWAIGCLSPTSRFVLLQVMLSIPLAVVVAFLAGARVSPGQPTEPGRARKRLTGMLMHVLNITIVILVAATLDTLSWWIAGTLVQGWAAFAASGGGLLVLIVAGRAILLWLKDSKPSANSINVARAANIAGLILGLLFLLLCATVVQIVVFYAGGFALGAPSAQEYEIWAAQSGARLGMLALPCLLYIVFTGSNLASLNASSLHNFYRARLTRSYVSVGNVARGFAPNALAQATPGAVDALTRVSDIVAGDDMPFAQYRPHLHGGPLHLINVCINQTVDDRTGEFNRDRKGRNMTLSSVGCDVGTPTHRTVLEYRDGVAPTLGQWIAISGAAAAPGMGARTSNGLAALLTLCGVRLGYWLDVARTDGKSLKDSTLFRKALPKYAHLLDEMLATFPGTDEPHWYVSDGGHFENTGVYALLKREVDVIVVADCGADPGYTFDDMNNLVRLARIDFNAEIIFQQPDSAPTAIADLDISVFGSLADIASANSASFLVMARVKYASGKIGHLLIIKPAMIGTLPLDLMSYKAGNPAFPEQPTADQFFDEAQWESYFRLGSELGRAINDKLLHKLPEISKLFRDQLGTGITISGPDRVVATTRTLPTLAATVVKSSIGVGAVAGLIFSAWQMWGQERDKAAREQRRYAESINKAIEKSMDSEGNLRLSEGGILFLEGVIKPGVGLQTDLDLSLPETLIRELKAKCPRELADDAVSVPCAQLAALQAHLNYREATTRVPYWPEWRVEAKTSAPLIVNSKDAPATSVAAQEMAPAKTPAKATGGTVPAPASTAVAIDIAKSAAEKSLTPPVVAADPVVIKDAVAAANNACKPRQDTRVRLFTLVYGVREFDAFSAAKTRPPIINLQETIKFEMIENVDATAKKFGTRLPYRWSQPTMIIHNESERGCAEKLAVIYQNNYGPTPNIRSLPEQFKKQPGVIEMWIPVGGAPMLVDKPAN